MRRCRWVRVVKSMGDRVRQLIHVQASGPVHQVIRAVLALVVACRWRRPSALFRHIVQVLRPSQIGLARLPRAVRLIAAAKIPRLWAGPILRVRRQTGVARFR